MPHTAGRAMRAPQLFRDVICEILTQQDYKHLNPLRQQRKYAAPP